MIIGNEQPGRHRRRAPGRISVVAAVVPVVLMGSAWTAAMAQTDSSAQAASASRPGAAPQLPDTLEAPDAAPVVKKLPSTTPSTSPLGPAAVTSPNGASNEDIPTHSLAAYQRTATVLAGSRAACRLPWSLVAAIGKVESNHGRYGGNVVGTDGVSRPGVRGIALDGTNDTARILDTDGGTLDGDATYDRAVGPMQFIPSTWRAVAVDGDGDGVKNPQDIDDAAMAAGVYLCAGGADLSTPGGARSAVLRYNQSGAYADLVLTISSRYASGDFSQAPDGVAVPVVPGSPTEPNTPEKGKQPSKTPRDRGITVTPKPPKAPKPTAPATPSPTKPTKPPTSGTPKPPPSSGTPTTPPTDGTPPTDDPTEPTEPEPTEPEPTEPEPTDPGPTEPEPTEPEPTQPPARETAVVDGNDEVRGADADSQRGNTLPVCTEETPGTAADPCVVKVSGDAPPAEETPDPGAEESTEPE